MEKKGLGRGLGSLIPGAGWKEDRSTSIEIPLDSISFNPFQPRKGYDDEKFQDLVRSVRVHGILQPVVVRSKGESSFELVAGERRLRAASEAGLAKIPAVVKELTNQQSLEVALIENIQREDISPLEAARAYRRLTEEFGLSQEEIAFRLGKSRSGVANTLRLLHLPTDIQVSLERGELTEGHARALLSISDPDLQRRAWEKIVGERLSVREAERISKDGSDGDVSRETIAPAAKDPNLQAVEDQLRQLFGTKVLISNRRGRGRLEIEFYSDDDLQRILALLFQDA
ncbi:MAG: ParB/RepB/Spo0J family partition protein [Armatimonadota bacterium]|nr:ParB/RepB/Spo0J family partition protein [Armatimonadota bacterium]